MIDERDLLKDAAGAVAPPRDVMDGLIRLRDRKQRNRRVGSAIIAVVVAAAAAIGLVKGFGSEHHGVPIAPTPSPMKAYHHNGNITVYGWVGTYDGPCAGSQPGPGDRGCGIFEVDPATGRVVPLPIGGIGSSGGSHSVTGLAWSPDGMELAYLLDDRVWIFHLSTGRSDDIMRCPTFKCDLAWSPDGTAIAVSHGDVLDLVGPKGDDRTTLTPLGPGATVRSPAWLPDGGIGFVGRDGRIFEIDRTGAHLRHLGDVPKGTWSPSLSPDGSKIAYLVWHRCGTPMTKGCPVTADVAPIDRSEAPTVRRVGRCVCLGINPGISWSPDEKQVAVVFAGLGVMNADGTGVRNLPSKGVAWWGDPAWRPVP